jgi:hypothetical protein
MEPFLVAECIKAKADGFITKPYEAGELIATIEKLAERALPTVAAMSRRLDVPKLGNLAHYPSSKGETAKLHVSDGAIETTERVAQLAAFSLLTAAPAVHESNVAAPAVTSPYASLRQQGREVCDVCGYVNKEHAFACQKCDVPLPSSVMSFHCR